ncbi:MAG: carboxymuconolactone decarboxylase family protein [Actinomycetota bacterium]
MARITPALPEQYEPLFGPDAPLNLRIHANRPELAAAFATFAMTVMFDRSELPPRLVELVRLRIAFHNQCRSCMAIRYSPGAEAGVTEDLVCSLESPHEADDLTETELAALDYADLLATNHLAIDDATYDGLREHFSEPEIVELGVLCALCTGFGRLDATWDMVDELPERFGQRGVTITPWGEGDVIRA